MVTLNSKFFIKVVDGVPSGVPVAQLNLNLIDPNFDVCSDAGEYVEYINNLQPSVGPYETVSHDGYEYNSQENQVTNKWKINTVSDNEKQRLIDQRKHNWQQTATTPKSWVFNEETCSFVPPIPKPQDENTYHWRESDVSWVAEPAKPSDATDVNYIFNIETETWDIIP